MLCDARRRRIVLAAVCGECLWICYMAQAFLAGQVWRVYRRQVLSAAGCLMLSHHSLGHACVLGRQAVKSSGEEGKYLQSVVCGGGGKGTGEWPVRLASDSPATETTPQ